MNRKIAIGVSAGAAGLLAAGLMLFFGAMRVPAETEPPAPQPAYTLREFDGRLAVFAAGEEEPIQVLDLDIRLLPPYDQGLLRAGIDTADEQELQRLLEDYTS